MRFHTWFPLLVLLLLAGCLEFDSQEITLHYDAKADRIDVQIVYRGIFVEAGSGSTDKPLEKALEDLAKVRDTGSVMFWCNWPFRVDPSAKIPAPFTTLVEHVDVENGPLFTDPQGVLCGLQFVRIREAKAFVQKVNSLLEIAVQASATKPLDGNHMLDDDTQDLLREFFRAGSRMLLVEPGRIELRLPCSTADHAWLKSRIEAMFANAVPREILRRTVVTERREAGGDPLDTTVTKAPVPMDNQVLTQGIQQAASLRFFWDNEWSMVREEDLTRIALGVKGATTLRIGKASDGLYHDGFLKHLREKGEAIEDSLPDAELERRFAQFRGRDAVLPPALAKVRGAAAEATAPANDK